MTRCAVVSAALGLSVLILSVAPVAFGQVVTLPPNVTADNEVTVLVLRKE